MQIQQIAIDALRPNPRNARTHPKQQIVQLVANIRLLGFLVPILADENGAVLAGHARLLAAKQAGLSVVPVIFVRGLSEAKKRALMLADNKIAENAGWNSEILAIELPELSGLLVDEGLDITLTGFSVPELSRVVTGLEEDLPDRSDAIDPAWLSAAPVSQPGDLWRLADHRLLCGDACNPDHLARLMAGAQASMAFLAPSLQQPQTRCRRVFDQHARGCRRGVTRRRHSFCLHRLATPQRASSGGCRGLRRGPGRRRLHQTESR